MGKTTNADRERMGRIGRDWYPMAYVAKYADREQLVCVERGGFVLWNPVRRGGTVVQNETGDNARKKGPVNFKMSGEIESRRDQNQADSRNMPDVADLDCELITTGDLVTE